MAKYLLAGWPIVGLSPVAYTTQSVGLRFGAPRPMKWNKYKGCFSKHTYTVIHEPDLAWQANADRYLSKQANVIERVEKKERIDPRPTRYAINNRWHGDGRTDNAIPVVASSYNSFAEVVKVESNKMHVCIWPCLSSVSPGRTTKWGGSSTCGRAMALLLPLTSRFSCHYGPLKKLFK